MFIRALEFNQRSHGYFQLILGELDALGRDLYALRFRTSISQRLNKKARTCPIIQCPYRGKPGYNGAQLSDSRPPVHNCLPPVIQVREVIVAGVAVPVRIDRLVIDVVQVNVIALQANPQLTVSDSYLAARDACTHRAHQLDVSFRNSPVSSSSIRSAMACSSGKSATKATPLEDLVLRRPLFSRRL